MIKHQKTVLILNIDDELAHKFCKSNSRSYNIIGVSKRDLSHKYHDVTFVKGDLYENTTKVLDDIINYMEDAQIDIVINNVFTKCDQSLSDENVNKIKLKDFFNTNVVLPSVILNYLYYNLWSLCDKEDNLEFNRQIINTYPLQDKNINSEIYDAGSSAFQNIMSHAAKNYLEQSGIKCQTIRISGLEEKEFFHCSVGIIQKLIHEEYSNETIYINKENYKHIHKPCDDIIFKYDGDGDDDDDRKIIEYKNESKKHRVSTLTYYLKGINNIEITDEEFKYVHITRCVTDEIINDINKEFNEILDEGLKEEPNKNYFSNLYSDGLYSYVPDIYSKSRAKNSKLIFTNSAFKEFLEENFKVKLSNEIYIDYSYRKPNSKETKISTGNDIVFFPPMSAPVNCAFKASENHGILNVHQSENSYISPDHKPHMLRQKFLTILIFLNDFGDSRGEGGVSFYADNKGHEILERFLPNRYSMLIFENNNSSFYNFLPNDSEEKMIKIHYHIDDQFTNKEKIVNEFKIYVDNEDLSGYIPVLKPLRKEVT